MRMRARIGRPALMRSLDGGWIESAQRHFCAPIVLPAAFAPRSPAQVDEAGLARPLGIDTAE